MFDDDKHNLKSVTNDYVKDTLTHDGMGNVLSSTIESAKTSAEKIVSSSTYANNGNLLGSVTQRGNTTRYGYSGAFYKMTGLKSEVTDPSGVKASYTYDAAGRPKSTSINSGNLGTVSYDYTKSLLTKITRTASGKSQVYNLTYDAFGNMTRMAVGSRTLMTYEYGGKNGLLTNQTYANGASTSFQYDALGRSTKTTTSDGDQYTYKYSGRCAEGDLNMKTMFYDMEVHVHSGERCAFYFNMKKPDTFLVGSVVHWEQEGHVLVKLLDPTGQADGWFLFSPAFLYRMEQNTCYLRQLPQIDSQHEDLAEGKSNWDTLLHHAKERGEGVQILNRSGKRLISGLVTHYTDRAVVVQSIGRDGVVGSVRSIYKSRIGCLFCGTESEQKRMRRYWEVQHVGRV